MSAYQGSLLLYNDSFDKKSQKSKRHCVKSLTLRLFSELHLSSLHKPCSHKVLMVAFAVLSSHTGMLLCHSFCATRTIS